MVVIDLHFLLRRPLTFSSGEETSVHSSDLSASKRLVTTDESALDVSTRGTLCDGLKS